MVTSTEELLALATEDEMPPPTLVLIGIHEGCATPFVAVIVTLVDDATDGAVNKPVLVIEPALAVHTTAVFGVDVRVATNCCVAPENIVAVEGESAIRIAEFAFDATGVGEVVPPQLLKMQASTENKSPIPEFLKKRLDAEFFP